MADNTSLAAMFLTFAGGLVFFNRIFIAEVSLLQGLNVPLFIGYVFNNAAVGIAVGIYYVLFQVLSFTFPDYGKGSFLTIFVENQERISEAGKKFLTGTYVTTILSSGFFMTFQILALNPESVSNNVFGPTTKYLIYANFVIYPLFCLQ